MRIISPKVEYWQQQNDDVKHIARCARVCYGKENGNNDVTLYNNLKKNKHWSVFRHYTYYFIVPNFRYSDVSHIILNHGDRAGFNYYLTNGGHAFVTINGNWALDFPISFNIFIKYNVTEEQFNNTEIGHNLMRYTFCITTQISTSRELNRVSPNNITERSTRYVYEDGTICRPHFITKEEAIEFEEYGSITGMNKNLYLLACKAAFDDYNTLIMYKEKRQDARGILPLDTATKVIYTYSVDEWKHIIKLRADKRAHPNAQIIANMIKVELESLGYDLDNLQDE